LSGGTGFRGQCAGKRDVVDVVPGGLRQRALLAPAGHAAIDQLWVARERDVGSEPEPLHHAGPKALDQRVGLFEQVEHACDRGPVLQIKLDDPAPAGRHRLQILFHADAIERHHIGAHVGEQHAGERPRADACEFDDAKARQRSGATGLELRQRVVGHGDAPSNWTHAVG
jgi:hypothetical protein